MIVYITDERGRPTKRVYVISKNLFMGTFSNVDDDGYIRRTGVSLLFAVIDCFSHEHYYIVAAACVRAYSSNL